MLGMNVFERPAFLTVPERYKTVLNGLKWSKNGHETVRNVGRLGMFEPERRNSLSLNCKFGCLTIIFVLIESYFKFICPDREILDMKIWFFLHRPLMISVVVLSIISLLIILSDQSNF
jgi:hypothetical protein